MNPKEARDIVKERDIKDVADSLTWAGANSDGNWCLAKGFLEGYSAGVREAADKVLGKIAYSAEAVNLMNWLSEEILKLLDEEMK